MNRCISNLWTKMLANTAQKMKFSAKNSSINVAKSAGNFTLITYLSHFHETLPFLHIARKCNQKIDKIESIKIHIPAESVTI